MIGEQISEGLIAKELARPRRKLRRNEKHEATKRRLFAAGIKVVGQYGYAEASVARITAEAGVAQEIGRAHV